MRQDAAETVRVTVQGAMPGQGFAAGTAILTLDGALPVEFLLPGDRVLTRGGARVLRRIEVVRVAQAAAIRIPAETLGVDTPADDLLVAPGQPVVVRDWRAPALCGAPVGMVAAERLVDGEFIRIEPVRDLAFFTLHFDTPAVIYAGGIELGCPVQPAPAEA